MMNEMFGDTIKSFSSFDFKGIPGISFLNEIVNKIMDMRTISLHAMWTSSNKVLFKEEVTDKLRKCLDVPRVFFSWLLLYCQETIAVQQNKATQVEVGKASLSTELSDEEKEIRDFFSTALNNKT